MIVKTKNNRPTQPILHCKFRAQVIEKVWSEIRGGGTKWGGVIQRGGAHQRGRAIFAASFC